MLLFIELLSAGFIASTPILLASLGGLYTYHSNVLNISMEGMMLTGAFLSVVGSYFFGSWIIGVSFAILGCVILSLLFSLLAVIFRIDEFVVGLSINMLSLGATTYAMRKIFGVKGAFQSPKIDGIFRIDVDLLERIPLIGSVLNNKNILSYLAILLVFFVYYHIFKTVWGLRLRTLNEDEKALYSIGISPKKLRFIAVIIAAIFSALAGSSLSLGSVILFTENMSNGRGWIALTLIIMNKGKPYRILITALLFGVLDGLGLVLQDFKIPSQITQMTPYIMTLVVLFIYNKKDLKKNKGEIKDEIYLGN